MRIGIHKYMLSGQLKEAYDGARGMQKLRHLCRTSVRNETIVRRLKAEIKKKFEAKRAVSPNPGEKKTGFFRRLLNMGRSSKG